MFTGIIQAEGRLVSRKVRAGDQRLGFELGALAGRDFAIGESVAVNGVCLTAVERPEKILLADVSKETLSLTTLGKLAIGDAVNLEPALAVGDRLGGHLVSGHVDGIGRFVEKRNDGRSWRMVFDAPAELARYIARKGSICIDGISLTVNGVQGTKFDVNIVPHTLEHTNLRFRQAGDAVNLEVDVIARYLERMLEADSSASDGGVNIELLKERGFL